MATEPTIDRDVAERARNIAGHHHHVIRIAACLGQSPSSNLLDTVVEDFQGNIRRSCVQARAVIPGERLIVNNARAFRQRFTILGSAAKWAEENLFGLHEQGEEIPLEDEIFAPKLALRDVPDEERERFRPRLVVLRRCGLHRKGCVKRWNHPVIDNLYPAVLVRELRLGHHQMLVRTAVEGCLTAVQLDQVA